MNTIMQFMICLLLTVIAVGALAQTGRDFPRMQKRAEEARLMEIQNTLGLNEKRMEAFRPIYQQYHKELQSLERRPGRDLLEADFKNLSNAEAEQLIEAHFNDMEQILRLRKKYVESFRKVLTPQELVGLFQAEAEFRRKVAQEMRRRRGGGRD